MKILENQTLQMSNLLSYRAKIPQLEFSTKVNEIEKTIKNAGLTKIGPAVSTTYKTENQQETLIDIEILIPLDKKIENLSENYSWKSQFLLTNALFIKHVGNPANVQVSLEELNSYIISKGYVPISSMYSILRKEAKTSNELDKTEIDIYVGINPNRT